MVLQANGNLCWRATLLKKRWSIDTYLWVVLADWLISMSNHPLVCLQCSWHSSKTINTRVIFIDLWTISFVCLSVCDISATFWKLLVISDTPHKLIYVTSFNAVTFWNMLDLWTALPKDASTVPPTNCSTILKLLSKKYFGRNKF